MSGDLIHLFPPYGIDQTIHVAILIGLLIALSLTETFGWVFSGLVVPGYLASLFVLEPASGGAVVVEAVLTFLGARAISELASRTGAWSKFFGRERFLLVIFVSIAVRQASELWLLPELSRVLDARFDTTYRLSRTLSSIGLVLVPLTANAFWKVGLRRGLLQVSVPTVLTYAILTYVLLPYTNLSFSRLELAYENVALDFLSSPKAYILLITGAFLGSRYNLLYGWDFAGILIPALLGIAWLSPFRLVTTLVETLVLVIVVRMLVRLPGLRTMNLEGPRKVVLVFTVSFFLKWTLGWFVGPTVFGLTVVELFGFGYLLSSLVAVKILQKDAVARIAVPAFGVGVIAWVFGSAIGFGLDHVAPKPPPPAPLSAMAPPAPVPATTLLQRSAMGVMAMGHVRARLGPSEDVPLARSAGERADYKAAWTAIARWLEIGDDGARTLATTHAGTLGLALVQLPEQVGGRAAWAMYEREERLDAHVGWDTAVLVPGARGPVIIVPRAADHMPTAEAAVVLCVRVSCRAVIAGGRDGDARGASEPLAIVRAALAASPMFELRIDASLPRGKAVFHVAKDSPDVDVAALWPAGIELSWQGAPEGAGAVLRAHADDYWKVIAEGAPAIASRRGISIESWFSAWYGRAPFALVVSDQAPSPSELRFLERMVAGPVLRTGDLRVARVMAGLVDYNVEILADGVGANAGVWVLAETQVPRRVGWGVLAGRVTRGEPITIEIPRPRRESGTLRLGVEAFRRLDASTLIVADPHVSPARGDADPVAPWNLMTSLHAFHQAAYEARRDVSTAMILQLRGFAGSQPIKDPLVVTTWRPILGDEMPARIATALSGRALGFLGTARLHDGSRELLDLAGTGNPQLSHCKQYEMPACALLWLSEAARADFREIDRDRELATLRRMGVAVSTLPATTALLEPALEPTAVPIPQSLEARYAAAARVVEGYAIDGNVQRLRQLKSLALGVLGGFSDDFGRSYLAFGVAEGDLEIRALVLVPGGEERVVLPPATDRAASEQAITQALARRPLSIRISGRIGGSHGANEETE